MALKKTKRTKTGYHLYSPFEFDDWHMLFFAASDAEAIQVAIEKSNETGKTYSLHKIICQVWSGGVVEMG